MDAMTEIDCKSVEQLIPQYLEGNLSPEEVRRMLLHIRNCRDCRDELEINFLLREGIRRVESGETLDLQQELGRKLKHSEKNIALLERIRSGILIIEGTAAFVLAACMIIMIFD